MRHTKIVATIGPASEDKSTLGDMISAGMNIVRLNSSHGDYLQFKKIVQNIQKLEKETGKIISTFIDLQGPKIRLGKIDNGKILVKKDEQIFFSTIKGLKNTIHIPYPNLEKYLKKDQKILIEDGLIRTKILSINGKKITVIVNAGGYLQSRKGVNLPDSKLDSKKTLTSQDKKFIKIGINLNIDAFAVSFVESAEDIIRVKKEIKKTSKNKFFIIAKIERKEALKNLEEIIKESDGIMVARGDLAIETKPEIVPIEQKKIITLCRKYSKPVIVATQMLQSMINNPIPTRAEISDAANAIFEEADAFMLSNETAVGNYPVKAVKTLSRVAQTTEEVVLREKDIFIPSQNIREMDTDNAMALNTCILAENINAKAIVVLTKKGYTASKVLQYRPRIPVICVSNSTKTAKFLNFYWGIQKILITKMKLKSENIKNLLKTKKLIREGDEIVIIKLSDEKSSLVQMKV